MGADDLSVAGSVIDSVASDAAAAVCRRFVEGVDERDDEEDDVERAALVDLLGAFFAVVFGVDADFRAVDARGAAVGLFGAAPSPGAVAADCSEGTDGVAPSSF